MLGHLASRTSGKYDVQYEKRRPAQYKCEKDQTQNLSGLLFRGHSIRRETVTLRTTVEKAEKTYENKYSI